MEKEEKNDSFEWSLKPLELITRVSVGSAVFIKKIISSVAQRWICLLFGCIILLANILINGPRVIDISKFHSFEEIEKFDGWTAYFDKHPDGLIQFVLDISSMSIFAATFLIPIIFLVTALFSNTWSQLILTLSFIEIEMNLGAQFHKKIRNCCIFVFIILILVWLFVISLHYVETMNVYFYLYTSRMLLFLIGNIAFTIRNMLLMNDGKK